MTMQIKEIQFAKATQNGVIYYSNEKPFLRAYETTINQNGEIETLERESNPFCYTGNFVETEEIEEKFSYLGVLLFDAFLIILFTFLKNEQFFISACIFALGVSLRFFRFTNILYQMKTNYQSTARFFAASNMVRNAYVKLQKVPTIEEAKKCSKISKSCTIAFSLSRLISNITILIVITLLSSESFVIYTLLAIGVPVILTLLANWGVFDFVQLLFASKPTDKELEVAIEAVKAFEKMENILEVPNQQD